MDIINLLQINKSTNIYSEIDIELLLCIICLKICHNAMETNCCHSLICQSCTDLLLKNTKKCPTCRQGTVLYPSILIRKVISSIRENCPLCGIYEKR